MHLHELATPCAVIDLDVLERNCARMAAHTHALGVSLRPHVKTHKCPEIARLQHGGAVGPITVSTLAEARHFAAAGFRDITWALPIPAGRIAEAAALARSLDRLAVLVDHPSAAAALVAAGAGLHVLVEVDSGDHRSGVAPDDPTLIALARRLESADGVVFDGLLTHAGHAYACRDRDAIRAVAAQERDAMVSVAQRVRDAGIPVAVVSIGSTPTVAVAEDLTGITEVRPGNYALFDLFQAAIGACTLDDVALTVHATVIGTYPDRHTAVLDAGALALSKDAGARHVDPDAGYGCLRVDRTLTAHRLVELSQEHGRVSTAPGAEPLRWGQRVAIVPNHSCLVAAQHEQLYAARGDVVATVWTPGRGW